MPARDAAPSAPLVPARPRVCVTRLLKNVTRVTALVPEAFPTPDGRSVAEAFGRDRLNRVQPRLDDPEVATDPHLRALSPRLSFPAVLPTVGPPLFSGSLFFVAVTYRTSRAELAVAPADLAVAIRYAALAAPPIARYAGQYGAVAVAVAPAQVPFVAPVPDGTFSDADVKGWVDQLAGSGALPAGSAAILLAPPGVENRDAPVSQGVLGYHGSANRPYAFVNVLGSGFAVDDGADQYALALSHEVAEMAVDPRADGSHPEVCDPCGPNCQNVIRDYFDAQGGYLGSTKAFPPPYAYAFFLNAIVRPPAATQCPAPPASCSYGPP